MCPYARNFSETSDFEIYYEHFSTRQYGSSKCQTWPNLSCSNITSSSIILQYMVAVEPHRLLDVASVAAAHSDCLSECSDQSNVTFNKQTCFHQRCAFRCTIFSCLFGAIGSMFIRLCGPRGAWVGCINSVKAVIQWSGIKSKELEASCLSNLISLASVVVHRSKY